MFDSEKSKKELHVLPDNRSRALADLLNTPQERNKVEDEKKYFLLYLNYAVNNIKQLTGLRCDDEGKVRAELEKSADSVIVKTANFLFLFNMDDPERDFKDYKQLTIMLVTKIFALRNLFAHPDGRDINALLADREFFVLLEGILLTAARDNAVSEGMRGDKLFKLKLLNKHLYIPETDLLYEKSKAYEFTRKGLIFITCLGLYRDEAFEFCSLFSDMRLPVRCPGGIDPAECENAACQSSEKVCNVAKAKALISMFTYFSCRKGRDVFDGEELDFTCFADIMGYLNKVPADAMDYLALESENARMEKAKSESLREDVNKENEYKLHKRFKERFISFAAGYCEDFDLLPVLRFKRLDISETIGRKRYTFGKETDNSVRMNRHYAIAKEAIGFEFLPEEHYGEIRIKSLRSTISESELRKLLYLGLSAEPNNRKVKFDLINQKIKEYFVAYHRILERMVNLPELTGYQIDKQMWEDLCTVTGSTVAALCESGDSFLEILSAYFPENLSRCFIEFDNRPGQQKLHELLCNRFISMQNQAADFLARIRTLKKWKRTPAEERKTPFPPDCTPEEVLGPNRSSRLNDGMLTARVFDLLNLYLTPEEKFRQLPRGEQHRDVKDHEYQLFHAAIGKYSLDQKGFESLLKKRRESLYNAIWEPLTRKINELVKEEQAHIERYDLRDAQGKKKRAGKTLMMLAEAAADLYWKFCEEKITQLENRDPYSVEFSELSRECRRYGVKTGMPLDRTSLIKTILRIDEARWANAYDYRNNQPFRGRELKSVEHIVSQVPFPNGFADRCVRKKGNTPLLSDGTFDFYKAMAELPLPIALRDYYNVLPLIEFVRSKSQAGLNLTGYADFSRTAVDKVRRSIKKSQYQDKLLLLIALAYRHRFMESKGDSFKQQLNKETDVYDYWGTPVICERKTEVKRYAVKVYPNDLTRPHFAQVIYKKNLDILASLLDPAGTEFDFFDLQKKFREVQSADRNRRLEILPELAKFEAKVTLPPGLIYEGKSDKEKRDMEFPFYQRFYPALSREEFEILVEIRNAVYHDGLNIQTAEALKILKKFNAKVSFRR